MLCVASHYRQRFVELAVLDRSVGFNIFKYQGLKASCKGKPISIQINNFFGRQINAEDGVIVMNNLVAKVA
ncbi:protein of unknown function [Agreia sp. COWG]|nr:protein of unknown function [Agreia sp. COWG]